MILMSLFNTIYDIHNEYDIVVNRFLYILPTGDVKYIYYNGYLLTLLFMFGSVSSHQYLIHQLCLTMC